MSEPDAIPPPARSRPKPRYAAWGVAVILVAATAGSLLAYNARRELARNALTGWLEARGVESEVEFQTFDLGSVEARLRIGPRGDPDVTAELAEVRYGLTGFWNGQPLGVGVTSVRLVRPVVKAGFKGGKLSLGSLDPIVEELTRRPPQPDRGQPTILVEGGRLALDTDYGRMSAQADARLENGRLILLTARVTPAELGGRGLKASLGETELRAATTGRRIDILVHAPVRVLTVAGATVRDADLRFDAQGPYPDLKRQRGDGPIFARLAATAASVERGASRLAGAKLAAQFDGTSAGWLETLALAGDATATLTADSAAAQGAKARKLVLRADATNLKWGRKGGDVIAADLWTEVTVGSARAAEASLRQANLVLTGPVGLAEGEPSFSLSGRAAGQGGWAGLGAPVAADSPETTALKRAVEDFRFEAPAFEASLSKGSFTAALGQPIRVRTNGGGEAVLAPVAGRPLFADGQGAFSLTTRGGGLPAADLAVDRYRATPDATVATVRLKAEGGFGPLVDARVETAGEARLSGGGLAFDAAGCTPFSLGRLEMGENDAEKISGQLCAPRVTVGSGGWRVRGRARAVAADIPFLEAHVEEVAGPVDLAGRGANLRATADIRAARVEDTAAERRFNPVLARGKARLGADQVWRAEVSVTDPQGRKLGDGRLVHHPDGRGGLDFATGELAFAEGGLQPADLSPLAATIGSPATGQVSFTGRMAWTPTTAGSGGRLDIRRLDFRSPAGPVTGLSGQVELTSLAPLAVAPGQVLKAEAIVTAVPLTDAELTFGLADETLRVEGARFAAGGGAITLEPFAIPLKPGAPWGGMLDIDGVQVKDFVEASPFGDRVDMDAKLTGKVPFQVTPEGVRVAKGRLYAVQPGRLSIRRDALVDVASKGGEVQAVTDLPQVAPAPVAPAETNTFTEFAYQAMEHLAFDTLEADVNSLPDGRLGVLFHIKGQHSPPQRQQIKLSVLEVIRQTYLTKPLPLPSGTRVDLTLDTTLNLDDLLKDFADYQALRGSQAVQPRR